MVSVNKNKLPKKKKSTKKPKAEVKKSESKTANSTEARTRKKADPAKIKAFKEKRAAASEKRELKLMHDKTHQDLINAAYKAAEELKIAPWVLLRAAEWGHFTEDRGKLYDGPMIDDLEGLDDDQKKALKKAVGL